MVSTFLTSLSAKRTMNSIKRNSPERIYTVPMLIDGKQVKSDLSYEVHNPATGTVTWHASGAATQNAIDAIESAKGAFPEWSKSKLALRRDIFVRTADIFRRRREELLLYAKQETGTDEPYNNFLFHVVDELLKDTAGRLSSMHGLVPTLEEEGRSGIILRKPYGIVLGIAPWNAPWTLGVRAICFALAAGNTTILKGSELSPRCFWAIADIFHEAGLPKGCLNFLSHRPQDAAKVTEILIEHPAVRKINFCGSTEVGRIIASLAGKYLKPIVMELGGKGTAIVLRDADINKAAIACAAGAFMNAGQVCMSTDRVLVHSSVLHEFQTALRKCTLGMHSKKHLPALINAKGAKQTRSLISDAISKGAKNLLDTSDGGDDTIRPNSIGPAILTNVSKDMDIHVTEVFGPSVAIYPFDDEDEAVMIANDTPYGLSGSIFTKDLRAGLRIAKQVEVGAMHINGMSIHDESALPHGGTKNSGYGRFNGMIGLEEYLEYKVITWYD